jgi:hypothetical protein
MNCDGLIANASSSIIHVPENIPMGGYDNRKGRCVGTRDMLYTRALSLSDGKETAVIITNDLLCVDGDMTLKIRNSLRNKFEINEKNVLVCATHTHSGPGVIPWDLTGLGGDNSEENQEIKDKITECIITNAEKSLVNMKPVKIGFGCSECRDVASNRADPSGVTDYSIGVISVMDNLHKPVAVIVNYACHPTVLGAENLYISADYPGVVQSKLTEHFGGEIVPMFINGACGNQSTRFTRKGQGFDEVERMGEILYRKTLAALNSINEFRSDIKIKIISEKVELPKKVFKNLDEALQNLQDAKAGNTVSV